MAKTVEYGRGPELATTGLLCTTWTCSPVLNHRNTGLHRTVQQAGCGVSRPDVQTRTVAVLQLSGGRHLAATLPVGAVISCVDHPIGSEAYFGMTRAVWEGRQYMIFQKDFHYNCEPLRERITSSSP